MYRQQQAFRIKFGQNNKITKKEHASNLYSQHIPQYYTQIFIEPKTGLEPVTHALRMRCSTN